MQPSESSLSSSGFSKVFLEVPSPLSRDSVLLVANSSSVLFIISQVFVHVMPSGVAFECVFDSLCFLVEAHVLPFVDDLTVSDSVMLCT